MLDLQSVSRTFRGPDGAVDALREVSLHVGRGELVALRGPSGCGKTTALLAAGTLLRPTSGEVRVDGRDPYRLPSAERDALRARRIGFVFQQFLLIPYLSVRENILAAGLPLGRRDGDRRADELIERFGLGERRNHVPAQLSTGERQRAALARALFNGPELILADEPTGNLDEASGSVVLRCLSELAGEGRAVLLVTHDPHAARAAHRVLRMEKGRLVEGGTT